MNIIKPVQQGLMTRTFVKDKRFYLSVAYLSYFPFVTPKVQTETPYKENLVVSTIVNNQNALLHKHPEIFF